MEKIITLPPCWPWPQNPEQSHSNNYARSWERKVGAATSLSDSDDSDDELGALIWDSSCTAQRFRAEKEAKKPAQKRPESSYLAKTPIIPASVPSAVNIDLSCARTPEQQGKKRSISLSEEEKSNSGAIPKKRVRLRRRCSHEGCTNFSKQRGVCVRHGAKVKVKRCGHEGCTHVAKPGGVCVKHGAKIKRCSHEGCNNCVQLGGVCVKHGAKIRRCDHEGCTKQAQLGGLCFRHGAKVKRCSHQGCSNIGRQGGVCTRHGAKYRRCSHEECTNHVQQGGVCTRHGAKRKTCTHEGCTNQAKEGGVCLRHGAKRCGHEGCPNFGHLGGLCWKHGGKGVGGRDQWKEELQEMPDDRA